MYILDENFLAIERTKLANQRTYLAFIRTGFAISAISGYFKKKVIFFFGIFILIFSTAQYIYIAYSLDNKKINKKVNKAMNYTIIIYSFLSLLVLFQQYHK